MAEQTPPIHRRLAQIALQVGGQYGFALAGGHAIAAHGILDRPSEDVDLFADWQRRADFPTAVDAVITAYRAEGFRVDIDLRLDTFARLHVTEPAHPDQQHRVELVANWRAQPPVQMDIGPVLHPDDVMAGKMDALYNRAAARDFLDIDAAISSGRYTLTSSATSRTPPTTDSTGACSPRCFATSTARRRRLHRLRSGAA
ncbi:nucleotidyl transferase AbiEii/AbiGii toxin family protein [Micromonospora sp. CPCC 205554]